MTAFSNLPKTQKIPLLVVGGLISIGVWGFFIYYFIFGLSATKIEGELQMAGGKFQSWTLSPDNCQSGERKGFLGVILTAKTKPEGVVSLVEDPVQGKSIKVDWPGLAKPVIFQKDRCPIFVFSLRRQNSQHNEIWQMDGEISIDCVDKVAGRLTGHVRFESCH